MKHLTQSLLLALVCLLIALLGGCSSSGSGSSGSSKATGSLSFNIAWPTKGKSNGKRDIPANTKSIVIQVQTADGVTFNESAYANNNNLTSTVNFGSVPTGSYQVCATAYDQTSTADTYGNVTSNGSQLAGASMVDQVVTANSVTNVNLDLGNIVQVALYAPSTLHYSNIITKYGLCSGTIYYADGTTLNFPASGVTLSLPSGTQYASLGSYPNSKNVLGLATGSNVEIDVSTKDSLGNTYTVASTFNVAK